MMIVAGAIAATMLVGLLLSGLRVREAGWRVVAQERRRRWEDSLR